MPIIVKVKIKEITMSSIIESEGNIRHMWTLLWSNLHILFQVEFKNVINYFLSEKTITLVIPFEFVSVRPSICSK